MEGDEEEKHEENDEENGEEKGEENGEERKKVIILNRYEYECHITEGIPTG